jgi:hypothetical protein
LVDFSCKQFVDDLIFSPWTPNWLNYIQMRIKLSGFPDHIVSNLAKVHVPVRIQTPYVLSVQLYAQVFLKRKIPVPVLHMKLTRWYAYINIVFTLSLFTLLCGFCWSIL